MTSVVVLYLYPIKFNLIFRQGTSYKHSTKDRTAEREAGGGVNLHRPPTSRDPQFEKQPSSIKLSPLNVIEPPKKVILSFKVIVSMQSTKCSTKFLS